MSTHLKNDLAVFLGGALGGGLRFAVSQRLHDSDTLLGTTSVNLLGSFLLVLLTYGIAMQFDLPETLILALGTGLMGGFTTFSSLLLNVANLLADRPAQALGLLAVNLVGGLLASALGYLLARRITHDGVKIW
ncbi:fluoride efflux transporter FluC [Lacticaseibacillus mingshuiensis]|uniref:Fluoride-specific ion channel FluC n=1 Tax=Lacticaseibacillus mingshuiensis TaxID=2799574 RepID=A0ABW4CJH5_9LACO|nr:CrcB family protein [Lacticaseibacillus mingshuiensis]